MDFDSQSLTSLTRGGFERPGSDIKKTGLLKKLKTGKRKFFVLRSTSSSGPARLEYYDSEKKFKAGLPPKRAIQLHTCFNINKSSDTRQGKHGIVLYTSDDCFTVVASSPDDQDQWLDLMLEFQNQYLPDTDMHKEHYDQVWLVTLKPMGLGQSLKVKGHYRLCLNSTTVSLVKASCSVAQYSIQLVTIRAVRQTDCTLTLELGKMSATGEGELVFSIEDNSVAKQMHDTLLDYMSSVKNTSLRKELSGQFRKRSESHSSMSPGHQRTIVPEQRPVSYYPPSSYQWPSLDTNSPGNHVYPPGGDLGHRPRSNTGESCSSRCSHHDDINIDFIGPMSTSHKDELVCPADLSTPLSPAGLDAEADAYLAMDCKKPPTGGPPTPPSSLAPSSAYLPMAPAKHAQHHSHGPTKVDHSSPGGGAGYMSMSPGTPPPPFMLATTPMPIPIHGHSFSEPHHSTLPTVREGGSNEGCAPIELSSSSPSPALRPEPATCMLSGDLPPRTYSLGSKPSKKHSGYMEMGAQRAVQGQDISRAASAPHMHHQLKGRRDPGDSPLSNSVKSSDDSDSFMEYMPMRPRTSSDSYNYRHRTNSLGKMQPVSRPRSSSHGQGQRPIIKLNKLSRLAQENRVSRESSLHDSFDSLRVSSESLRRTSQDMMRQQSGSNASDYADMRCGSSCQSGSNASDYADMRMSARQQTGSNASDYADMRLPGRQQSGSNASDYSDVRSSANRTPSGSNASDYADMRLPTRQPAGSNASDYADMRLSSRQPSNASDYADMRNTPSPQLKRGKEGDSYMSMQPGTGGRGSPHRVRTDSSGSGRRSQLSTHGEDYTEMAPLNSGEGDSYINMDFSSRNNSVGKDSKLSSGRRQDAAYVNMDAKREKQHDPQGQGRSSSMENVDSYMPYDPSQSSQVNDGSTYVMYNPAPNKTRAGSLGSKDKRTRPARKGASPSNQPTVSASTKKGGSSDSIRKASRQSSMEKTGSLGKDFRKKSASTGSRPGNSAATPGFVQASMMPVRQLPQTFKGRPDEPNDEYVEFDPSATLDMPPARQFVPAPHSAFSSQPSAWNQPHVSVQSSSRLQSQQRPCNHDDDAYTPYAPGPLAPPVPTQSTSRIQQHQCSHDNAYTPYAPAPTPPNSSTQSPFRLQPHECTHGGDDAYLPYVPGPHARGANTPGHPPPSYNSGLPTYSPPQAPSYGPGPSTNPHTSGPPAYSPMTPVNQASSRVHLHQCSHSHEDYTPYAPGPLAPPSSSHSHEDYTPYAPGPLAPPSSILSSSPAAGKSVHFHQPPSTTKPPSAARPKQPKDESEYVAYEPGNQQSVSNSPGNLHAVSSQPGNVAYMSNPPGNLHCMSQPKAALSTSPSPIMHVEVKDAPEYVGFNPAARPLGSATPSAPLPIPLQTVSRVADDDQSEYVSYQPSPALLGTNHRPGGVHSSIHHHQGVNLSYAAVLQQQAKDTDTSPPKPALPHQPTSPALTLNPDPPSNSRSPNSVATQSLKKSSPQQQSSHVGPPPAQQAPLQPLGAPLSTATTLLPSLPPVRTEAPSSADNCDYLQYNPAVKPVETSDYLEYNPAVESVRKTDYSGYHQAESAKSDAGRPDRTTDHTNKSNSAKLSDKSDYLEFSPAKPSASVDKSEYLDFAPAQSPSTRTITPSFMLKENTAPGTLPSKVVSRISEELEPEDQSLTRPLNINVQPTEATVTANTERQHTLRFDRQLSAPVVLSQAPSPSELVAPPVQSTTPCLVTQTCAISPAPANHKLKKANCSRQPTGSSVDQDCPGKLPSSRHKHNSGPPSASQKAGGRKSSSDSEKSLRKGSKSDSNSSLTSLGSKNKKRTGSGEKSPMGGSAGSAEKSPLSPSRGSAEFFGADSAFSGKDLDAKIVPVESKIRLSLGDMTADVVNKDGNPAGLGLSRPGSTPCMQSLDPADPGSRSTEELFSGQRLSEVGGHGVLGELGAFHHSGLGQPGSHDTGRSSESGSAESCGNSGDMAPKPLNYVTLDMGTVEGGGGSERGAKSRNSSDADERQPPLSYAEIDFVKSQNLNKGIANQPGPKS